MNKSGDYIKCKSCFKDSNITINKYYKIIDTGYLPGLIGTSNNWWYKMKNDSNELKWYSPSNFQNYNEYVTDNRIKKLNRLLK